MVAEIKEEIQMVIRKAARVALAKADKDQKWLAGELKVHESQLSTWINSKSLKSSVIERMAKVFDMSLSEFLALGE